MAKEKIIAQILYFFRYNILIEKQFVRKVIKETNKSFLTDTNETFSKAMENKPKIIYGSTVILWKTTEIETDKDLEQARKSMCKELKNTLVDFLHNRADNIEL